MARHFKDTSYFQSRPDIVKIFDDLEKFLDFCRFNLLPYNEADLYNNRSAVWREYENSNRPRREWKPRGEYNRSGNGHRNYQR